MPLPFHDALPPPAARYRSRCRSAEPGQPDGAAAVNVHEIWADQRLKDGWRIGPARDDAKKEHPCLVPYEELPEGEKEYDRRVVRDTVRAILALGYRIEK